MKNIVFESATELIKKIKAKEITVEETVTAFLNHIEKFNPRINAISDLREKEEILNEARDKDLDIEQGKSLGLLHGLPITIKDSFLAEGLKNSNGDPFSRNFVATEDAELVKRLKDAGAIIIGKTNTALYCIDWQSTNF